MKAVLVGLVGKDKLYYDLDAKQGAKDGIVERQNGSTVDVDFTSFVCATRGLRKIRSSTFHRFLWDAPKDVMSGAWYDTFINKTRSIKDEMLEKIQTHPSLGEQRKQLRQKSETINNYITATITELMSAESCCGEMVQFNTKNYKFLTPETRKVAWEAIKILTREQGNE